MNHEARQLADLGISQSAQAQDRRDPEWSAKAYGMLREFVTRKQWMKLKGEFTAEDVKYMAYLWGLPRPLNESAWGGIFAKAARNGLIQFAGWTQSKNASRHCTAIRSWRLP
jgi:hypothetical protein